MTYDDWKCTDTSRDDDEEVACSKCGHPDACDCPCCNDPECTCYEIIGGHQMGCYYWGRS